MPRTAGVDRLGQDHHLGIEIESVVVAGPRIGRVSGFELLRELFPHPPAAIESPNVRPENLNLVHPLFEPHPKIVGNLTEMSRPERQGVLCEMVSPGEHH